MGTRSPDRDFPPTPFAAITGAMADGDPAPRLVATGPVLVFGGPYGNLEATGGLLAAARACAIAPDHLVCTGDLAAYGADPVATIALVRASGARVVMGNVEEQLAAGAAGCGCGFDAGTACDALAARWYAHADAAVDVDARRWMARLPRRIDLVIGGRTLAVVHGGASRINRFVFASQPDVMAEELGCAGTDGVVAGHCGLPFTRVLAGRLWHNAGAIGLPAHDGTARVWYSVLTPTDAGLSIERRALSYDFRTAAAKMRAARLPEGYAAALERGLWPSEDVLPAAERARRGVAITEEAVLWPRAGAMS